MTTRNGSAYRWRLADSLDGQSQWRAFKAEEWPEDERNLRSSRALAAAAEYVRQLDEQHPGIRRFVEFAALLDAEAYHWATDPEAIIGGNGVAGRFFFGKGSREPGPPDFDRLLEDMFGETLGYMRETSDWLDARPSDELARYFDQQGYPLWSDEEDDV